MSASSEWNKAHPEQMAAASRRYRTRNPAYVQRDREAARDRMSAYRSTARGMLTEVRNAARRRSSASEG